MGSSNFSIGIDMAIAGVTRALQHVYGIIAGTKFEDALWNSYLSNWI